MSLCAAASGVGGKGVVGEPSTGDAPGTMFFNFSKNGSLIPKAPAGVLGVLAFGIGVLSLSMGVLPLGRDGFRTLVSIFGGDGSLGGISDGWNGARGDMGPGEWEE